MRPLVSNRSVRAMPPAPPALSLPPINTGLLVVDSDDPAAISPATTTVADMLFRKPILAVPAPSDTVPVTATAAEMLLMVPILAAPAASTTPALMLLIVPILFVPAAKTNAAESHW